MKLINFVLSISLLIITASAFAQNDLKPEASKPMAPGHGFAPIVYEACKGKKAGDAVKLKTPDGSMDAVCMETSRGLAAGPGKSLGEDHGAAAKPVSSQAFEVCKGKKDGDGLDECFNTDLRPGFFFHFQTSQIIILRVGKQLDYPACGGQIT